MAIRVDIDENDIMALVRATQPRLSAATISFAAILTFLFFACLGAGYSAYIALAPVLSASSPVPATAYFAPASLALMALASIVAAFIVVQERRRQRQDLTLDRIKPGLTTGRFEFNFTDAYLIVKGPLVTKKALWGALDRIEETKKSIIFWRRGRVFAFIPTDMIADEGFYERLMRVHGPAIDNNLSFDKEKEANPHSVQFEWRKADLDEYRGAYRNRLDGQLSFLRAMGEWRPWRPILFTLALQITLGAAIIGAVSFSVTALAIALAAGALAVAIVFLDTDYFRGPAHPTGKNSDWPFAQSEIVTVTLADAGVFLHRAGGDEIFTWSGVAQLVECKLAAYLVLSPRQVIPLPMRAFMNKVHYAAFTNYAQAQVNAAQKALASKSSDRMARALQFGKGKPVAAPVRAEPAPPLAPAHKDTATEQAPSAPATTSSSDLRAALQGVRKTAQRRAR